MHSVIMENNHDGTWNLISHRRKANGEIKTIIHFTDLMTNEAWKLMEAINKVVYEINNK